MTTASLKKKLITAINKEDDKGLLEYFYAVLAETTSRRISQKQYNREIEEGDEEVRKGKTSDHSKVVKEVGQWLKRK